MALHKKLEIFKKRQLNYEFLKRQKLNKKTKITTNKSNFELTICRDIYTKYIKMICKITYHLEDDSIYFYFSTKTCKIEILFLLSVYSHVKFHSLILYAWSEFNKNHHNEVF